MASRKTVLTIITSVLVVTLLFIVLQVFLAALISQSFRTAKLQTAYQQQYLALNEPLKVLGITTTTTTAHQCDGLQISHFGTVIQCHYAKTYPPNSLLHPLSAAALADYPAAAAKLDSLLAKNGWLNDSPKNNSQTIASIQTNLPALNGNETGIDVPYHKSLGPISCNLIVSFNKNNSADGNYRCSENFSYPGLHFKSKPLGGV